VSLELALPVTEVTSLVLVHLKKAPRCRLTPGVSAVSLPWW